MSDDRPRIVLVDDEELVTRMISMVLEDTKKFRVETVNNPLEAMSVIKRFKPHIIVLDVLMPGLSGVDLGIKIREHPMFKVIPILFLTAAVSRENPNEWRSSDGGETYKIRDDILLDNPVISKPVSPKELMAKFDEILAAE